jgi:PPOX class probable F420-dependent enzyme
LEAPTCGPVDGWVTTGNDAGMILNEATRAAIESGRHAHVTTIGGDGRPHTTVVWVGLDRTADGDEIVIAKLQPDQKLKNLSRDPRVTFSMEADGTDHGLARYLVVEGTARVTEGGAPPLLHELAQRYLGPGSTFPPMPNPPDGFIIRITPTKVRGMGPWGAEPA